MYVTIPSFLEQVLVYAWVIIVYFSFKVFYISVSSYSCFLMHMTFMNTSDSARVFIKIFNSSNC